MYHYSKPTISEKDIENVVKVLRSEYLTQGPITNEFERKLEEKFGSRFAITCNSGTSALHMTYKVLGLGPKKGLVTSAITFMATANAAKMCNAPVAFADVDPRTGNVNLETIKRAVDNADFEVKVISVVHLGGRPVDIEAIYEFSKSIGAYLIEDACHAPLAQYLDTKGNMCKVGNCNHSIVTTLSFHAIKHITTGEGGAVLTNNEEVAEKIKLLRSHNIIKNNELFVDKSEQSNPWYYEMSEIGYNYRLSDINCALGLNQIDDLEKNILERDKLSKIYNSYLKTIKGINIPIEIDIKKGLNAWHLYSPRFDFEFFSTTRSFVMSELKNSGIGTQVHYIPLYRLPFYKSENNAKNFPGAEKYYLSTLSLPMYSGLNDEDIAKIVDKLLQVLKTER